MRTTRFPITKNFIEGGLNPYPGAGNTHFFHICKNASISKEAAMDGYLPDFKNILDPDIVFLDSVTGLSVSITKRWPFPQLFLTDVGMHIGALEGLFYIQQTTPTVVIYSYGTGAVTWPWSCADINQRPAFTSGNVLVYFDPIANAYTKVTYA